MSKYYKDLDKPITELFHDDYVFNKNLNIKTKSPSGVEWMSGGTLSPGGALGTLGLSFKNPEGFSLENLNIKTDGKIHAEANCKISESAKLTATIEDGRQEPGRPLHSFGKLGCEFVRKNIAAHGEVDIVNGPSISSSLVYKNGFFGLGGDVFVNTHFEEKDQAPEIVDCNFAGSLGMSDWIATIKTTDYLGALQLGYLHRVSPSVEVGGHVDYRLKSNNQTVTVGARWRPDEYTVIKGKINSESSFSCSLKQKISQFLRVTLSAEAELKVISSDTQKFGFALDFNA